MLQHTHNSGQMTHNIGQMASRSFATERGRCGCLAEKVGSATTHTQQWADDTQHWADGLEVICHRKG